MVVQMILGKVSVQFFEILFPTTDGKSFRPIATVCASAQTVATSGHLQDFSLEMALIEFALLAFRAEL
jgi:hypothetical protein